MTEKRFTLAYADYDWWAICDKENPTELGISGEDVVELLNELNDENEQLMKEIYKLHKRLGDFKPFEQHMKGKTSKTSANDIIGLVKTDELTNSVELKKELYK